MAVDHRRIRDIVGEGEETSDTSLRGNSLRRALNGKLPRTMTPFEWEQWYSEKGIPEEHKRVYEDTHKVTGWAWVKHFFRIRRGW